MRPTAKRQSALRAPLNDILGTEANVRVLRVLSRRTEPIAVAELARQAQLQSSTVHRALKSLESTGIIEFRERRLGVALRTASPLAKPIRELFAFESKRSAALIDALIRVGTSLSRPPIAMWLQGPAASGVDRHGDSLVVVVVDDAREIDNTRELVRRALEQIERTFDVSIEVRGQTRADLNASADLGAALLDDVRPLVGVPPAALLAQTLSLGAAAAPAKANDIRVHQDHDTRGLAMGKAIAKLLIDDPTLVKRARAFVEKRWRDASARERKELEEWRSILRTASATRLRRILTDPGERSTRLRQTFPFVGILSKAELRRIRSNS